MKCISHLTILPPHFNHKIKTPKLALQQNQLGPSDVVVQHLKHQALNQTQLNDALGSILSGQQNLQQETVSVMNEMSKRQENEQFIRDIQIFDGQNIGFDSGSPRLKR